VLPANNVIDLVREAGVVLILEVRTLKQSNCRFRYGAPLAAIRQQRELSDSCLISEHEKGRTSNRGEHSNSAKV